MWACKMIPVLIYWASVNKRPHCYSELSKEAGHKTNRIGDILGIIEDVFKELRKEKDFSDLPSVNGLVMEKGSALPKDGLEYVYPEYGSLSLQQKRELVDKENTKALNYGKWEQVLKTLQLEPYKRPDNSNDKALIRKGGYTSHASESNEHKALKQYIYDHPEKIGIKNWTERDMEHILLSGDRLDVYIKLKDGTECAIEVKSRKSDEADILRGIYQCVKYNAILKSEQIVNSKRPLVKTLLVLEGTMPFAKASEARALHINYEENITPY